jgi:hypothetical protein
VSNDELAAGRGSRASSHSAEPVLLRLRVCSQPTSPELPLHELRTPPRRKLNVPTSDSVLRLECVHVSVTQVVFDCSRSAIRTRIRPACSAYTSGRSCRAPQQPNTHTTHNGTAPEGSSAGSVADWSLAPGLRFRCAWAVAQHLKPAVCSAGEEKGRRRRREQLNKICMAGSAQQGPHMVGTPHVSSIHLSQMSEFTQRNVQHSALHVVSS